MPESGEQELLDKALAGDFGAYAQLAVRTCGVAARAETDRCRLRALTIIKDAIERNEQGD